MGFTVMATASIIVIAVVTLIALIVYEAYSNMATRKRQAALEYLLKAVDRMYFYGRPVAKCLEKGVVWELNWEELGDFTRPMGYLVLYALGAKGSGNAQIHWVERYDLEMKRHHYSAHVVFDYCGRQWMLDLRGQRLDGFSFKRHKSSEDSDFASYGYWDIDRRDRYLAENCTDPERSKLTPDFYYREMEPAEFEREVEHLVMFFTI